VEHVIVGIRHKASEGNWPALGAQVRIARQTSLSWDSLLQLQTNHAQLGSDGCRAAMRDTLIETSLYAEKNTAQRLAGGIDEAWLIPWIPPEGDVFLDLGANIGNWTRYLASSYGKVHALEPNPRALPELRANLPDNVVVHDVGGWDTDDDVEFSQFTLSVHMSAYFKEQGINTGDKCATIDLPCRRIDSLPIDGKITFIKCDTEGAELRCIQGAAHTIDRDRPTMLVEVHSRENLGMLLQLFADWGYLTTVIRNPHYQAFSDLWYRHCWLLCDPRYCMTVAHPSLRQVGRAARAIQGEGR
jgi:FkbM family methyltransferase